MKTNNKFFVRVELGNDRVVKATWAGGAHMELRFGDLTKPTEVISVWDDVRGEPMLKWEDPYTNHKMVYIVQDWAEANENEGWTSWYEDHLAKGRS